MPLFSGFKEGSADMDSLPRYTNIPFNRTGFYFLWRVLRLFRVAFFRIQGRFGGQGFPPSLHQHPVQPNGILFFVEGSPPFSCRFFPDSRKIRRTWIPSLATPTSRSTERDVIFCGGFSAFFVSLFSGFKEGSADRDSLPRYTNIPFNRTGFYFLWRVLRLFHAAFFRIQGRFGGHGFPPSLHQHPVKGTGCFLWRVRPLSINDRIATAVQCVHSSNPAGSLMNVLLR